LTESGSAGGMDWGGCGGWSLALTQNIHILLIEIESITLICAN